MTRSSESPGEALGQTVLDFLQSVGRPAEAEMYLRLFRSFPRGRFAVVAVSSDVLPSGVHGLVQQLRLLVQLGLYPVLVVGVDERVPAEPLSKFRALLLEGGVGTQLAHGRDIADIQRVLAGSELPIVEFPQTGRARAEQLIELITELAPRKVVILRSRGGVGPEGGDPLEIEPGHMLRTNRAGISALNVVRDMALLLDSGRIQEEERRWLELGEEILRTLSLHGVRGSTVSYAAPFSLLRELLTVKGEGTLLKLGSVITEQTLSDPGVHARVEAVLSESFGRKVKPEFFQRSSELLLIEENDRGLALLEPGVEGRFLSKFAVLPVARGEGLGQDLWWEMRRRIAAVYWRSRPENPINDWYRTVCDGMQRIDRWWVFWYGIPPSKVFDVITDVDRRPEDFLPTST